jgi:malto-oligosyltrehalose synthase
VTRVPLATYRLQVNADFTLHDAAAIVEYLHALGITDLYLSPVFEAMPGSTHGYDVTDPTRVREELGGRAALDRLTECTHALGMAVLLDIVPNHMAASEHGAWWRDVLRRGRASPYAGYFDINWGTASEPRQLLLPILGVPLEQALEQDQLALAEETDGEFSLLWQDRRLPLAVELCPAGALDEYRTAGRDRQREILRDLLARQHYRLEHWVTAGQSLGYRRFFDITDLAGVRVEQAEVFYATHALVLELTRTTRVAGLRIDHVDGLWDPAAYLDRLRQAADTYIVVEKILGRDEPLPPWPVDGTTGYDFLNLLNGLYVDHDGHERILRAYQRLTGETLTSK